MLRAATPERPVDGSGTGPLDLLVQQLWQPVVRTGEARVVVNPRPTEQWAEAESYWVVPSADDARLLVPTGPRAATAGALANYRGLRTAAPRTARTLASSASRAGLPLSRDRLVVQVRPGARRVDELPLRVLARALGMPRAYAALGVRTGANRKATLQLVDHRGRPAGYAKVAWSRATRRLVETETAALRQPLPDGSAARMPGLLATGRIGQQPYLVTQPLPLSARSPRRDAPVPAPQELAALSAPYRRGTVARTGQFEALSGRLATLSSPGRELGELVHALADRLAAATRELPVTERWHGDLVPWNTARDADDALWCWDWESSERDAVAGLDALHWAVSQQRMRSGIGADTLREALEHCRVQLWASGLARRDWPLVAGVYALTTTERAGALAAESGWPAVWIDQDRLGRLLGSALAMLEPA